MGPQPKYRMLKRKKKRGKGLLTQQPDSYGLLGLIFHALLGVVNGRLGVYYVFKFISHQGRESYFVYCEQCYGGHLQYPTYYNLL